MSILETELSILSSIEDNLFEADYSAICCKIDIPLSVYKRFFSYTYKVPFTTYISGRRLSISAKNIINNVWSISEATIYCHYEDLSSFSRAFKLQFGVSPKHINYDIYLSRRVEALRVHQNYISETTSVEKITYHKNECLYVTGIHSSDFEGKIGSSLWDVYDYLKSTQSFKSLFDFLNKNNIPYEEAGVMSDFENSNNLGRNYLVGIITKEEPKQIAGLRTSKIAESVFIRARVKGENIDEIIKTWYLAMQHYANVNGFEVNTKEFYWIEIYQNFSNYNNSLNSQILIDFVVPGRSVSNMEEIL